MKENRIYKDLGISSIKEIDNNQKELLIRLFAKKIVEIFNENHEFKDNKDRDILEEKEKFNEIVTKMTSCDMYICEFEDFALTANYYFKNQTIYFNQEKISMKLDQYVIHEFIHFYQDVRENGILKKFGLCECLESKLIGVGLNEGAVQYIAAKILNNELQEYIFENVTIKTKNKDEYPILNNLIEQLVYLIGDKELIDSAINCNNKFKDKIIDCCGEKTYKELIYVLDKILELENKYFKFKDFKDYQKLMCLYENAQKLILLKYFKKYFPLIETSKELEDYKEKLIGIKEIICNIDNFCFYEKLKKEQIKIINKRIVKMNRKFAKNSLKKYDSNILYKMFLKIKELYRKEKDETY